MRALCLALDEIDERARRNNEPGLAVLVVRVSDGLPGAGWWVAKDRRRYNGSFEGPEAQAYIKKKHSEAFRFWRSKISAKTIQRKSKILKEKIYL